MNEIEFDEMDESELVEVAKVLSRRLIEGIIRESRLASEMSAIRDDYEERGCGLQGIHNSRERIQKELDEAKDRIKYLEETNGQLYATGKGFATEADECKKTLMKVQEQLSVKEMNERRLERELREARRTVMDEVSAMIPKAVEAERDACADIARSEALRCASPENTSLLMAITNMIKARGERK